MRKRFIITNVALDGVDKYKQITIFDGVYLFYTDDLNVSTVNSDCIVIGNMFSSTEKNFGELLAESDGSVEDALYYMCGRYVVIYKNRIYMDAIGLLGVFYTKNGADFYISNDLTAYEELLNKTASNYNFEWRKDFINYMPAPLTTVEGVYKLFNKQCIELESEGYKILPLKRKMKRFELSNEELFEKLKTAHICLFRNIANRYDKVSLTLTGGVDSRTSFAFMQAAGIEFSAFSHYVPDFNKGDMKIPKRIAKRFKRKYTFVKTGAFSKEKETEYDAFVANSVADGDRYAYSNGINYPDKKGTVVIKSAVYESFAVKSWYGNIFPAVPSDKQAFLDVIEAFSGKRLEKRILDSLSLFYDEFKVELSETEMGCLFYRMERDGVWLSYIERSLDLLDCDIIQPCNCLFIAELWSSFPDEMRTYEKEGQKYVVKKLYPELAKYPYNPTPFCKKLKKFLYPLYKKLKRK